MDFIELVLFNNLSESNSTTFDVTEAGNQASSDDMRRALLLILPVWNPSTELYKAINARTASIFLSRRLYAINQITSIEILAEHIHKFWKYL